jgi:predicted secreted protein
MARDALIVTMTLAIEGAGPLLDEMSEESVRKKFHQAFTPVVQVLRKKLGTVGMGIAVRRDRV